MYIVLSADALSVPFAEVIELLKLRATETKFDQDSQLSECDVSTCKGLQVC